MAYDASFAHARKYYAKKKYRHAEVLFMRAYKNESDKRKKAQILRLMAAARYYQGKSKLAKASFKLAKKLSPTIKMVSRDKKLVAFFKKIDKKRTSFIVNSNAPDASVLLDGIYAGRAGEIIEAPAGIKKITITSDGFKGRITRIKVNPNRVNKYTVNLREIRKAPMQMVQHRPRRVRVNPLPKREYYQPRREEKIVMPRGDFLSRAQEEGSSLDAKKELEMETNPSLQVNRAPQHTQAPAAASQPYSYSYGSGVYIAPPPPPMPVANPLPVPLYYQQQVNPYQAVPAPAAQPQSIDETTNVPVLLHH